jgi:hypothetical protein
MQHATQQSWPAGNRQPVNGATALNLPLIPPMLAVVQVEPVKQRDWEAKRRENDLKDVAQAGSKMGVKREVIEVRRLCSKTAGCDYHCFAQHC